MAHQAFRGTAGTAGHRGRRAEGTACRPVAGMVDRREHLVVAGRSEPRGRAVGCLDLLGRGAL